MEDIIKVSALGGLDENGRDCYVIEINNDIFVLDAGLALPDKTIPGVDFLRIQCGRGLPGGSDSGSGGVCQREG